MKTYKVVTQTFTDRYIVHSYYNQVITGLILKNMYGETVKELVEVEESVEDPYITINKGDAGGLQAATSGPIRSMRLQTNLEKLQTRVYSYDEMMEAFEAGEDFVIFCEGGKSTQDKGGDDWIEDNFLNK